jgi:hypothetical protein
VELIRTAAWVSFNVLANGSPWADTNWWHAVNYGVGLLKLAIGSLLILRREGIVTIRRRIPAWVRSARRWPD